MTGDLRDAVTRYVSLHQATEFGLRQLRAMATASPIC